MKQTMRRADHIIDLGPRAGMHGGEVVASGTLREIERAKDSETGRCLKTPLCHPIRKIAAIVRRVEHWIEIRDARANNLKNVDVRFPSDGCRSSPAFPAPANRRLMGDVLLPAVREQLNRKRHRAGRAVRASRWHGSDRCGLRSRSIAHRQNFALDPGDLHQSLR